MGKNRLLKNLLLLLITVAVTLILLEILLRLFYPQNLNYTKLSETKIFEHKPGISTILRRNEFATNVKINSQGFRDVEHELKKPEGTARIAFIGDSFVFGFGVELNETMVKALESKLNSRFKKNYEAINFGVSAYGTEQEYILIRDDAIKYSPDIIVLAFSPNDFKENVKFNLFDVRNGTLIENPPIKVTPVLKLRNYASWHSHLYSLIYFSVIDNQKLRGFLIKAKVLNPPFKENADFDSLVYLNSKNGEFDYAVKKTVLLLDSINDIASKNNIPLIIFIVPTREQVDSNRMNDYIKAKNLNAKELNATKVQDIIKGLMPKNNTIVIDPLEQFKSQNANNTFYYNIDGHWNKNGHQLAAGIIYESLIKHRLVS